MFFSYKLGTGEVGTISAKTPFIAARTLLGRSAQHECGMADIDGAIYENNKRLRCVLLSVKDNTSKQASIPLSPLVPVNPTVA